MQVTMQHALKLFWRPKAIELEDDGVMTYEKVEIIRRNDGSIRFNNKMPYHVTLGYIGTNGVTMLPQTQSLMVLPFSHADTQFKNVPSTFQVGGNDSNLLIVFYVQIMPDDFVMQLHRF